MGQIIANAVRASAQPLLLALIGCSVPHAILLFNGLMASYGICDSCLLFGNVHDSSLHRF